MSNVFVNMNTDILAQDEDSLENERSAAAVNQSTTPTKQVTLWTNVILYGMEFKHQRVVTQFRKGMVIHEPIRN